MKVRFIHDLGGEFEAAGSPSYLDVEMDQPPIVGDRVHLPEDFYAHRCNVIAREWFLGTDRAADVLITVTS